MTIAPGAGFWVRNPADYLTTNFATNLQGYWPLSADAKDISGGGNDGVVLNTAPTYGQTGIPGSALGGKRVYCFSENPALQHRNRPPGRARLCRALISPERVL